MKYDPKGNFFSDPSNSDVLNFIPERSKRQRQPHIALIGCFRPRQCGIATFTADVYDHLIATCPDVLVDIYSMRSSLGESSDPKIAMPIDEDSVASYRAAADAIGRSGASAVWLQHEFGIFGGAAGELVLELVDRIAAPLIITLHTLLAEPTDAQRRVMDRLVNRASRLVVMSEFGRETLIEVYGAAPASVVLMEHGTPDRPFTASSPLRAALGIGDRPVLSTFGLLGPGKGLETAIRALPAIAAQYPDVLYRIVGATHPNLVAMEGESYREGLERLADELGVKDNIAWENRFLGTDELLDQIELCDIYLAPYPNLAQITSGTLAYAVALGRAVVSTPFVHARELLANDVGILVPQGDSDAIAEAVLLLLSVPEERRAFQQRAYERGRRTAWPEIARQCALLLDQLTPPTTKSETRAFPSLGAIRAMSDGVGILQHGLGIIPDRDHGYCIDDNARALMLMNSLPRDGFGQAGELAIRYASFVQHAWNPAAGRFRNFMGYDRRWLEDEGSEDSNGRALWTLGHCAGRARMAGLSAWGLEWFERTAAIAEDFRSPRAIAFAVLGADELLARHPRHAAACAIVERGGAHLHALWKSIRTEAWNWFEPGLAYDNARLAEALIRAGCRLRSLPLEEAGLAALDWLCDRQTARGGHFRPVGSEGFGLAGETLPFDQQPLEAWATIAACGEAFVSTGLPRWSERAEVAWRWFLGDNDRAMALASAASGRCCDGLTPQGVNSNVGAESTLAFHLAYHAMNDLFWRGGIKKKAGRSDADLQTRTVPASHPQ